jgi:TRAP transporter TAXI family solute receptor
LKFVVLALTLALAISLFAVKGPSFAADVKQYQMVAASMGGVIYRWMAAYSKVFNEDVQAAQFTVRTGFPGSNVLLVEHGEAPIAASGPTYYNDLYPDDPAFEKTRILTLWPMFSVCRYLVVPPDSPYKTYSDLKGKKIAVGIKTAEGGDFLKMVKALGWKEKDINFYYVGKNEGMTAYKDGTVDAWTGWTTRKSPHFMRLAASKKGARLILFTPEELDQIQKIYPAYYTANIPAGAHELIKKDSPTIFYWLTLNVRDDFPEDIAYQLAKVIDTRRNDVAAVFKGVRDATPENAVKFHFFKLHPGTVKYLKEKGYM